VQKRNPEHPTFLTDGTYSDIDPTDPEQLLLPGFLSALFFCHGYAGFKELTACRDVVFAVTVCQQAEVTYPYIPGGQDMK
jgi:hypothetical protein